MTQRLCPWQRAPVLILLTARWEPVPVYRFFLARQPPVGQDFLIHKVSTRVRTLIVATIYLQLIQNRYMFRSFTVLQCSHQHCVQPVASDVEVVGYL